MRRLGLWIVMVLLAGAATAQRDSAPVRRDSAALVRRSRDSVQRDSARLATLVLHRDSLAKDSLIKDNSRRDSLSKVAAALAAKPLTWKQDTLFRRLLNVAYLPVKGPGQYMLNPVMPEHSRDELFWLLTGMVLFLSLLRTLFPKYFANLFRIFFQSGFRQKQTREQLGQEPLGAGGMNLLFVTVLAALISEIAVRQQWTAFGFDELFLYSLGGLTLIYVGKFLFVRFAGWVFGVQEAAETYTFIVFLINKMLGIFLIPLLWLMVFSADSAQDVILTLVMVVAGIFLLYRYISSIGTLRRNLGVHPFHFFIYLCGVEVLPFLIAYKALFGKV